MFTNEAPMETPTQNTLTGNAKNDNHFEQFTYAASANVNAIPNTDKA
jgi:hypothetical protein